LPSIRKTACTPSGKTISAFNTSPAFSQGLTPGNGIPFATVAIRITHPDYETEEIGGVQVFPNTVTVQSFRMIPLAYSNETQSFTTPPQNL